MVYALGMSQLANRLTLLTRITSVSTDHQTNQKCLADIGEELQSRGMNVVQSEHNGFPLLTASTTTSQQVKVLLAAHVDVVPAEPEQFIFTQKDGKYFGRGVFDMKFAIAYYLQLVEELQHELSQYNFAIMLTSDEEVGGNSVQQLLEQGHMADVCILPDGGNDWQIEASSNGAWFVKLTASGQQAHGSRPWEGENAIDRLVHAIGDIQDVFGELNPERCSITVSKIEGGSAVNQVPAEAYAVLDMRFRDQESYQTKREQIELIVAQSGLVSETIAQVAPGKIDLSEPHIAAFIETAEQTSGVPVGQCHSLGASDAHYFADRGIPTVVMRPTGGNLHGDSEWLDKQTFLQFYDVLKAYITKMAKIT